MAKSKSKKIWSFFSSLEGDKVVWIITLMLLLLSIVCMFSSTSRLLTSEQTRLDIVREQFVNVALGLGIIIAVYNIRRIGILKWFSQWGFVLSIVLLIILDMGGIGPIKAPVLNNARRCLIISGFQVHVFEIVKVAMVMYLAWAIDTLERDKFWIANRLSKKEHFHWLATRSAKSMIYLYLPVVATTLAIVPGSNTSAVFIGGIMFLTLAIGGGRFKELIMLGVVMLALLFGCVGLYQATKTTEHPLFERIGTGFSRLSGTDYVAKYNEAKKNRDSDAMRQALDKLRQPYSARLAIKQGGFIGKGPGQSTQRYVVPDYSEDYMFSFIVEEYGLIGAILVMALFVSLLARGSLIARNCGGNLFAKTAVAGLALLISGQAFMHMFVNADFGLLTGQTLPLLSHGTSAFLCFCVAFGILLSISRIAQARVQSEIREALKDPLMATNEGEVKATEEQSTEEEQQIQDDGIQEDTGNN